MPYPRISINLTTNILFFQKIGKRIFDILNRSEASSNILVLLINQFIIICHIYLMLLIAIINHFYMAKPLIAVRLI